jgi:hypothetical protein
VDPNGDGDVTLYDAVCIAYYYIETKILNNNPTPETIKYTSFLRSGKLVYGDVDPNGDGDVTLYDAVCIAYYYIEQQLPNGPTSETLKYTSFLRSGLR